MTQATSERKGLLAAQAQQFASDEFFDSTVYTAFSNTERDEHRKQVLQSLADTEFQHYLFWKQIANVDARKVKKRTVKMLILMRKLFGLVFTMKFL